MVKRVNECAHPNAEYSQRIQDFINYQMPGMKAQEHIKIIRTIGFSPEELVATAKHQLQPSPYPLP